MNLKKAKKLRRILKGVGIDLSASRQYVKEPYTEKPVYARDYLGNVVVDEESGHPVVIGTTATLINKAGTPRAMYLASKKL